MQNFLLAAGVLAIFVGVVHSVLGEKLIFSRMRGAGVVPTIGQPLLRERHVRILWASWHIVTVFGFALAAILIRLAYPAREPVLQAFVEIAIVAAMSASSVIVLFATRGRHPGWLGLLGIAIITWLA